MSNSGKGDWSEEDKRKFGSWEQQLKEAQDRGDVSGVNSLMRRKPKSYSPVRSGGFRIDSDAEIGDKLNRLISGGKQ